MTTKLHLYIHVLYPTKYSSTLSPLYILFMTSPNFSEFCFLYSQILYVDWTITALLRVSPIAPVKNKYPLFLFVIFRYRIFYFFLYKILNISVYASYSKLRWGYFSIIVDYGLKFVLEVRSGSSILKILCFIILLLSLFLITIALKCNCEQKTMIFYH